jgi:hypothetical protein
VHHEVLLADPAIFQDHGRDGDPDGQGRCDPEQIMAIMPAEIRARVKLYLEGTIRQWYSKGDGKGVILLIDAKTVDQGHAVVDTMPLSKENLVDHEYTPVGPLVPLAALISR